MTLRAQYDLNSRAVDYQNRTPHLSFGVQGSGLGGSSVGFALGASAPNLRILEQKWLLEQGMISSLWGLRQRLLEAF